MQHQQDFLALVEEYRPLIKEIDIVDVKNKIESQDPFTLVDVREEYEWQNGHLTPAIHIARGVIERDINKNLPNKDHTIILYCAGGFRSVLAAYTLQKIGYTQVYSMKDGIKGWIEAGYPL